MMKEPLPLVDSRSLGVPGEISYWNNLQLAGMDAVGAMDGLSLLTWGRNKDADRDQRTCRH